MQTRDTRRRARRLGACATALLLAVGASPEPGGAQIAGSEAGGGHWIIAPYGWMAGISGETGVRDLSADVDVSFFDLLSNLSFAAMGTLEGRYGSWLGGVDAMYTSVEVDDVHSIGPAQVELVMSSKLLITNIYAGYSFISEDVTVDLLAGARVWSVDMGLRLATESRSAEREHDGGWVDAVGGARIRWSPAEDWHLAVAGDGGAGGSRSTAGVLATGLYDFSSRWSVFGALRFLHVDRVKDDFFFDGHMLGPVIGVAYRW